MTSTETSPEAMPLEELRALRGGLQHDDDAISYVRRLTQAKLDMVRAEQRRRERGTPGSITQELPAILAEHLTAGGARPPRPAEDFSDHPLATELDDLEEQMDGTDVTAMSDGALAAFASALADFEHQRSQERHDLFTRIDALSAELVRRYRDDWADGDGLRGDDD